MASSSMFCSAYEELPNQHQHIAPSPCASVDVGSPMRRASYLVQAMAADDEHKREEISDATILPPPESWFQEEVDEGAAGFDGTVAPLCDSSSIPDTNTANLLNPRNVSAMSSSETDDAVRSSLPIGLERQCIGDSSVSIPADTPPQQPPFTPTAQTNGTATLSSLVGAPLPSPSWQDVSLQLLPTAARELFLATVDRVCYTARWSYAGTQWRRKYNDLNSATGYYCTNRFHQFHTHSVNAISNENTGPVQLPLFSSLTWVDRQLVKEWRTYLGNERAGSNSSTNADCHDEEELEFDRARTLVPPPAEPPAWRNAESCVACHRTFGPTSLRHHCRHCGGSFCQQHSARTHSLPHLGFHPQIPERVCDGCKDFLLQQNLAERITWRLARCRDYGQGHLQPYFEIGLDSVDQIALRITNAALTMAKSIPLGAQATVAVETVDVLRKYGLNGIYTIMLRQEFLAAADLLLKALGINRTAWPLSVHELSAAIFYALAQHRAMRGMNPDREDTIHAIRDTGTSSSQNDGSHTEPQLASNMPQSALLAGDSFMEEYATASETNTTTAMHRLPFEPVCDSVSTDDLSALIFYAPIALNFIYVEKEVDMQLLAAQQGWRLLYAYLDQEVDEVHVKRHDRPASALFVHTEKKIACLAVRGTTTIHDVVTDVRQVPVPFPDIDTSAVEPTVCDTAYADEEWTAVHQGLAVAGMAGAAANLYREHIDALLTLSKQGYRIRMTGHSLGGSVAVLLGVLVNHDLRQLMEQRQIEPCSEKDSMLRVYSYGTPSCVDLPLAESVESFVTTVVLHDDVVPRLTPTSCRGLLKHLLHIRETWVKVHFADDLRAFTDRAKTAWAPKWRPGFTLSAPPSVNLKLYCRQQLQYGKKQLRKVKDKLVGDDQNSRSAKSRVIQHEVAINSERESIEESPSSSPGIESKLVMDVLGGMGAGSEGMIVDGDEFFESEDKLLYTSDEENELGNDVFDTRSNDVPIDALMTNELPGNQTDLECDESQAVFLEELPLPRMFIPGRILHIYSHRGVYKAAYVPRTFRELRRISMAGNMLSDHKTKSYYDALLEVANVRSAKESSPHWTAFDEDDTCSCCASRFTWASTSHNEAQQARDKHNCRSCGSLVCDPCARNRIPVPSIGLTVAVRVCDRCYFDINGMVHNGTGERTNGVGGTTSSTQSDAEESDVPMRQREKRSVVVDDLARRVQTSGLACT